MQSRQNNHLTGNAARANARGRMLPWTLSAEDIDRLRAELAARGTVSLQFPIMPNRNPEGFTLRRALLTDRTGTAAEGGPVITIKKLVEEMLVPGRAYGIACFDVFTFTYDIREYVPNEEVTHG